MSSNENLRHVPPSRIERVVKGDSIVPPTPPEIPKNKYVFIFRRDPPESESTRTERSAASRLRTTFVPDRLAFTWLGVRRTTAPEQRTTAAPALHPEGAFSMVGTIDDAIAKADGVS